MIVMKFGGSSLESAAAIAASPESCVRVCPGIPWWWFPPWARPRMRCWPWRPTRPKAKRAEALRAPARARGISPPRIAAAGFGSASQRARNDSHRAFSRPGRNRRRDLCAVRELTPRSLDAVASYGERLSSRIVALGISKAREFRACISIRATSIVTDSRYTMALAADRRNLCAHCREHCRTTAKTASR